MTKKKKFKLNEGDIFTIPLTENEVGFGQIVIFPDKHTFIMVVYDYKTFIADNYEISDIINKGILLLGYLQDERLYNDIWHVVGNATENLNKILLPYNKLGVPPGDIFLVDYLGNRLAEITEDIFNQLSYESTRSGISYEKALKAHFNILNWKDEDYDKMLYKHTIKSNEIARKILLIDNKR